MPTLIDNLETECIIDADDNRNFVKQKAKLNVRATADLVEIFVHSDRGDLVATFESKTTIPCFSTK